MTEVDNLFSKLNLEDGEGGGGGGGEWITASKKNKKQMKKASAPSEGASVKGSKDHYSDMRAGVILKKDNKYLLVRGQNTYDSEGKWGFPKGHLEKIDNDDLINTAIREVFEETQIKINSRAFNRDNTFREEKNLILYIIDVNKNEDLFVIPKEFRKANEEIKKVAWFTIDQMKQTTDSKVLDKINSSLRKWLKNQK